MSRPKAILAWSSGKDAAFALHEARSQGQVDIVGVLTTLTEGFDRVSMHGVREQLLDLQADAIGLPCHKVRIPFPCPNEVYEERMGQAMEATRSKGVACVVFGDLFLSDVRAYREKQLARAGMKAHFPLWGRDTRQLAREMVSSGLRAIVTCLDPRAIDPSFAGRAFDVRFLEDLPEGVDPCGENGEFHTVVVAGPMMRSSIQVELGPVVDRDGFVFVDVVPAQR